MTKQEFINPLARAPFEAVYGDLIGGKRTPALAGRTFDNISPINGAVICAVARSEAADVEAALDAAHAAKDAWGRTSAAERAYDPAEDRRPHGGEPPRCSPRPRPGTTASRSARLARRHPAFAVDHCPLLRRLHPRPGRLDLGDRPRHHRLPLPREPLGVVGQIIRWRHPDPDGGLEAGSRRWRPATAVVLKPAKQTPASIMVLMEIIGDLGAARRAQRGQRLSGWRPASRWRSPSAWPRSPSPARPRPAS